jgi:hypothetical protein
MGTLRTSWRGSDPLLADLLSACLTAIEQGDATLQSCLAEYPAQAEALRPLLETALAARAALAVEPPLDVRDRLRVRVRAAAASGAPPAPQPQPVGQSRRPWAAIGAALAGVFRQRPHAADAPLGELLAAALTRIEAGEATIESTLAAHPAQAAQLRPLLETALAARGAFEREPSAAVHARLRARVLAAAAPRPMPVVRRPLWQPAATAALALAFLVALAIPVGMLANGRAVPGDWNYGLKRTGERVRLAVTLDNGERRALHLALAQRREREIQTLLEQNRTEYLPQAVRAFNIEVGNIAESLNRGSPLSLIEARRIAEASARQEEVLKQVAVQAPPPARAAAEEALSTVAQTRSAAIQAVEQRDPQLARALEQAPTPTPTPAGSGGISRPPVTVSPPPMRTSTVPTLVPEPTTTATATPTAPPTPTVTATPSATSTVIATMPATAAPPAVAQTPAPTQPGAAPTVPISAAAAQASAAAQSRAPTVLPVVPSLPPAALLTPTPTPSSRVSTEVPAPATATVAPNRTPTATPRPTETPAARTPAPPAPVRQMLGVGTNTLVYVGQTPTPLTALLGPILAQVRQVRIYSPGAVGVVVYTPGQTTIQPVVMPFAWLEIDMAAPAPVPSLNLVPGQR